MVLYRTVLLFGFGLMATFGSSKLDFPGAGPLGCLTMAFVAAFKWRKEDWSKEGGVSIQSCYKAYFHISYQEFSIFS